MHSIASGSADCCVCQFATRRPLCQCGSILVLGRNLALDAVAIVPGRAYHGEWYLFSLGQTFDQSQVAKEHVQDAGRGRMLDDCLGWSK